MLKISSVIIICILFILIEKVEAYDLPPLNLGFTSFFDGGPLGPSKPGLVFQQYVQHFHSDQFLDHHGKKMVPLADSNISVWISLSQLLWATKIHIIKTRLGIEFLAPIVIDSHITKNPIDLKSSGSGFGNIVIGPYLQWDAIMKGEDPFYVQRVEVNVTFPVGKNKAPEYGINPGNAFYSLSSYWAATLFFNKKISASWRLHYLWCSKDHKTHIQPGQTTYLNYILEYQPIENLFLGANGYFLQQLENSKFRGRKVSNSKERVFAIGPGILYAPDKKLDLIANLYFESLVKNRAKGIRVNIRAVKKF